MKLKIFAFLAIIICSNNFLNAEETNKEINSVHECLGKLAAESEELGRHEHLSLYRFKAAAAQSEIQTLEERWRVWSTSENISQRVRTLYETHRQPETLRDASQWLEEITAGRYLRPVSYTHLTLPTKA